MEDKILKDAMEWAKTRKRITNKPLRDRYNINEDEADEIYAKLKEAGIIQFGGYVIVEENV